MVRCCGWVLLALSGLCAFLFYDQYWRWRDCFNELGRCYSPEEEVVFTDDAAIAWGGLTFVFLSSAAVVLTAVRRRTKA
jgi:hypothetical protein